MDGGLGDAESCGHLACGEHAVPTEPLATAGQFVSGADKGDLLQVEGLAFPGLQPAPVEDLGDFAVAVAIDELIDLGDKIGPDLTNLSDREGSVERQAACGSARQPDMSDDRLSLDQVAVSMNFGPLVLTNSGPPSGV